MHRFHYPLGNGLGYVWECNDEAAFFRRFENNWVGQHRFTSLIKHLLKRQVTIHGLVFGIHAEMTAFVGMVAKVRITSLGGMLSVVCLMATHRQGHRYAST